MRVLYNNKLFKICKLSQKRGSGLIHQKLFLLICLHFTTALQNRDLVDASTNVLSNFGDVKTRTLILLLVEGILFIVKTFKIKTFISDICNIPHIIK